MSLMNKDTAPTTPVQSQVTQWRVTGASVRGASHVRTNAPNQDAIRWVSLSDEAGRVTLPLVVALSDGHGSAKSFRSHIGASLAVEAATVATHGLFGATDVDSLTWQERLPQSIVAAWRAAVKSHLSEHPLSNDEWAQLGEKENAHARASIETNPHLAYGATLLLVAVTHDAILCAQLGDGDILLVSDLGEVRRPSWPKDERLFANETTSLCMDDAWREMKVDVAPISHLFLPSGETPTGEREHTSMPALILLATDGYTNSFADDEGFLKVGSDILEMIRTDGLDSVSANLAAWLDEASQHGSGDDITVGIVCRVDAIPARLSADAAIESRSPSSEPAEDAEVSV
jgi:serine/threonine protein phosphatase PrpC